jgi:putative ABC transport system substrate-binding protein
MEERATALGLEHHILAVRGPDDFEAAFKQAQRWGAGAVSVRPSPLTYIYRSPIASAAMAFRLPTISWFRAFAEAGGLMTYAPDERELLRRGASYIDRILKGAKPADLPVEQPTKFEFVINMKTAKALGLTIPRTVLVQADKVIR